MRISESSPHEDAVPAFPRMNGAPPHELASLLNYGSVASKNGGWARFVAIHSKLLLQVTRAMANDHDAAMDHYAHILEQLRSDDFRRLRAYSPEKDAKFTTWLAVVARRLCFDRFRTVYGRTRERVAPDSEPNARRRLVNLVAEDLDVETHVRSTDASPEMELRAKELHEEVAAAIGELSERDQLLMRLRYQDELPVREIASLLDYGSIFPVYRRLKVVQGQLKSLLERRGVADAEP